MKVVRSLLGGDGTDPLQRLGTDRPNQSGLSTEPLVDGVRRNSGLGGDGRDRRPVSPSRRNIRSAVATIRLRLRRARAWRPVASYARSS